jgi:predicted enzyme related to lactoylglutathione lyase
MKIDSLYVGVKDMKRAISFYEKLFGKKAEEASERFTSFDISGMTFALYNSKKDGAEMRFGNNCVPNIQVEDAYKEYERIQFIGGKPLDGMEEIEGMKIFQFLDTEGNVIEFYQQ